MSEGAQANVSRSLPGGLIINSDRLAITVSLGIGAAMLVSAGGCASSCAPSAADMQRRQQALAASDHLIVPGERIGPIRIGMGMDEVQALLGRPDSVKTDHPIYISWRYSSLNLLITFEKSATPSTEAVTTTTWAFQGDTPNVTTVFHTAEGVALNVSPFDVKRAFGEYKQALWGSCVSMVYPQLGLSAMSDGKEICSISIQERAAR